jgi:hypothetical protein
MWDVFDTLAQGLKWLINREDASSSFFTCSSSLEKKHVLKQVVIMQGINKELLEVGMEGFGQESGVQDFHQNQI